LPTKTFRRTNRWRPRDLGIDNSQRGPHSGSQATLSALSSVSQSPHSRADLDSRLCRCLAECSSPQPQLPLQLALSGLSAPLRVFPGVHHSTSTPQGEPSRAGQRFTGTHIVPNFLFAQRGEQHSGGDHIADPVLSRRRGPAPSKKAVSCEQFRPRSRVSAASAGRLPLRPRASRRPLL